MKLAVDVVEITYEIGCGCPQSFFCGTIFAVYLPQIGTFVVDKRNAPNRNFRGTLIMFYKGQSIRDNLDD